MKGEKGEKTNQFFRVFGIIGASLALASTLALATFLILDLAGVNELVSDDPRYYIAEFISEDEDVSYKVYTRGEKIEKPANPTHSPKENYIYTFKGWDLNGDHISDAIPSKAYYSFKAVAIYSSKYIGKEPEKNNESNNDGGLMYGA